jgi:hypothetical protein
MSNAQKYTNQKIQTTPLINKNIIDSYYNAVNTPGQLTTGNLPNRLKTVTIGSINSSGTASFNDPRAASLPQTGYIDYPMYDENPYYSGQMDPYEAVYYKEHFADQIPLAPDVLSTPDLYFENNYLQNGNYSTLVDAQQNQEYILNLKRRIEELEKEKGQSIWEKVKNTISNNSGKIAIAGVGAAALLTGIPPVVGLSALSSLSSMKNTVEQNQVFQDFKVNKVNKVNKGGNLRGRSNEIMQSINFKNLIR